MPSKPNLTEMLSDTAGSTRTRRPQEEPRQNGVGQPDRGQLLGSHIPPEAKRQFDMLSAELGKTKENLHAEAINDLFAKYRKPEICPIRPRGRNRQRREENQ